MMSLGKDKAKKIPISSQSVQLPLQCACMASEPANPVLGVVMHLSSMSVCKLSHPLLLFLLVFLS